MSYAPKSADDRFVLVTEVGTRDGFQSEKEFIPTEVKAVSFNINSIKHIPTPYGCLSQSSACRDRITKVT